MRYATLLCNYGVEKGWNDYISGNEYSPTQKSNFMPADKNELVAFK